MSPATKKRTGIRSKRSSKQSASQQKADLNIRPILLDSGPLGQLVHPRKYPEIKTWVKKLLKDDNTFLIIPEIVDYELRRNFLLEGLSTSIDRLDQFKEILYYSPITTETMLKAAELWSQVRKTGKPTSGNKELDVDVILAAQALIIDASLPIKSIIATTNIKHISRFVDARNWQDI